MTKARYCTTWDVYTLGGLSSSDIDETTVFELIKKAIARVNEDISTRITLEPVQYIDEFRQNDIDGSNTRYYTKHSYKYCMGDLNDDGILTGDDIEVWEYKEDDTREQLTITRLTKDGMFDVSSAPANSSTLKATYRYLPLDIDPVHPLIRDATAYLTAAYAHANIEPANFRSVSIGKLKYTTNETAVQTMLSNYYGMVRRIDNIGMVVSKPGVNYLTIDFEDVNEI